METGSLQTFSLQNYYSLGCVLPSLLLTCKLKYYIERIIKPTSSLGNTKSFFHRRQGCGDPPSPHQNRHHTRYIYSLDLHDFSPTHSPNIVVTGSCLLTVISLSYFCKYRTRGDNPPNTTNIPEIILSERACVR